MTSTLVGASGVAQLEDGLSAVHRLALIDEESADVDQLVGEGGINLWAASSEA